MPNLNSERIEEKEIDVGSALQNSQTEGLKSHLRSLIASQRRNLQNLSILVVVNFISMAIGFITTVKIANSLGKETFGLVAYGLAIAAYGGAFIRFGQDRTLVRELIHYPERFGELVAASLMLRWCMLVIVVASLLIWKLCASLQTGLTWGVVLIIIANSLMSLDLQPVYDSWHKMGRHAVYNLMQRSCYFVIIWATILISPQKLSVFWIGAATLFSVVLYLILQHSWAIRQINMTYNTTSLVKAGIDMAKSDVTILLATIGLLSFGALNQLVLKHYCGTAELGGYAAAWQIASVATILLSQVSRVGSPATARNTRPLTNKKARIHFLVRYSSVMFLTAAPICIPLFFFPEIILKTIFKPEYASAAGVLRTLSVYMVVYSLGVVASQYVVSSRMERTYFASVIVGGILSITLCLVLIPRMAGYGAALALLIAHSVSMGLYWMAMIQHVRKQR